MQTVAELQVFRKAAVASGMSDEDIHRLIEYLGGHPDAGDEIQGTGGCRKLRFSIRGNNKGKSGGVRVITFFTGPDIPLFLITVFAKSQKVNLTQAERHHQPNSVRIQIKTEWRNIEMTKQAFDQISEGLNEALLVAKGEASAVMHNFSGSVDVKAIRAKTGLTQKEFAHTYGFGIDQIRQWEQGRVQPVQGAKAYLLLINNDPDYVASSLLQIAS